MRGAPPGRSAIAHLTIDPAAPNHPLSYFDETTHQWRLAAGTYRVYVGSSERDTPLAATATTNASTDPVLYFPLALAPIAVVYNVTGFTELRISPDTIADIFDGDVVRWNAPAINPVRVKVPLLPVVTDLPAMLAVAPPIAAPVARFTMRPVTLAVCGGKVLY